VGCVESYGFFGFCFCVQFILLLFQEKRFFFILDILVLSYCFYFRDVFIFCFFLYLFFVLVNFRI